MNTQELTSGIVRITADNGMMLHKDDITAVSVDTTDGAGWVEITAPDYPDTIPEE